MIGNFGRVCQEYILWLEITMHDSLPMKESETPHDLPHDNACIELFDDLVTVNKRHEISTGCKLDKGVARMTR